MADAPEETAVAIPASLDEKSTRISTVRREYIERREAIRRGDVKPTTIEAEALLELDKHFNTVFKNVASPKQRSFLAGVATTGTIASAARVTGLARSLHYVWKRVSPHYADAFSLAREIAADFAEDEVFSRAFEGREEPLTYKGKRTGDFITKFSDDLAKFWLKGSRPDKYRDSMSNLASTAPVNISFHFAAPPTEDSDAIIDVTPPKKELTNDDKNSGWKRNKAGFFHGPGRG